MKLPARNDALIRARIVRLDRAAAEAMRDRIARMGHPTLFELGDAAKTVYELTWLHHLGAAYRIER